MGPFAHALAQPTPTTRASDAGQVAQDIAGAGRVRMQSQRLAKLYQQAGMGLRAASSRGQIDATNHRRG